MSGVPAASQPPQQVRWVRVISVALRLAVIVLIMAAAWWLINAYRGVVPTRATGPKPQPAAPETDSPGDWLLAPGGWSLGDTPWQMTRANVSGAELPPRMSAEGPPLANRPASAIEADVVEWLKRSAIGGVRKNGIAEYTLTVNHTQFRGVIETTAGGDRLRLGQVAWPDEGGWQLLELLPTAGEVATAEPLLPPPVGAALVARRWSDGRVVADLVGPVSPDADPAAEWSRTGWSRVVTPGGPVPAERYGRGESVREVWRLPGAAGGASQDYLLVFVPPTR